MTAEREGQGKGGEVTVGKPGLGPRSPVWLGQGKLLKLSCL